MSSATPIAYNVVFDPDNGLRYEYAQGYISISLAGVGITQLTGDVTAGPGSGLQAASISNATVTGKLLTGFVSGAGTVAATDTILAAIDKLDGNIAGKQGNSLAHNDIWIGSALNVPTPHPLTGDVSMDDTGNVTVASVGGFAVLRTAGGTLTGVVTPASSTNASLTGTVTPVTNVRDYFYTVTGNTTLNGPASPTADGQKVTFRILNDGSHSVTLATGAGNFRFGTDITAYTNSVSLTDYIGAAWNAAASRWDVIALIQGF